MKARDKKEAWYLADKLFPTDYAYDEEKSRAAGYDIYSSEADGVDAWISDLNDRIELNYPNGSSENIWIEDDNDFNLTDDELHTILWALQNEYFRAMRRRVENGKSEPCSTENKLLEINKKLYSKLLER